MTLLVNRLFLPIIALAVAANTAAPDKTDGDAAALIPEAIRSMLDAALKSGNVGDVSTIVKYARIADPETADTVLAIAEKWRRDRDRAHREVLGNSGFLDLWTGKVELGGYLTTGNSKTAGGTIVADAVREGLDWRHKFHLQADYQSARGVTTREHYLASYEPNYKINDRAYVYGAAQFESDRFLGYNSRYTLSSGVGYSVVKAPPIQLNLELGPAYRQTQFTNDTNQSSIAGRGTLDLKWKILDGFSLEQQASAYVERYNSTLNSMTALRAKLLGPLSAQLSYNVQYESEPPAGSVTTDTTSRASLVYSF